MSARQDVLCDPAMASSSAVLEARGVWKWLGGDRARPPALQDVTLSIPAGSWTVFTGPSGSGKTTLLSLLGALDRPSQGQILFEGQDLTRFSDQALARTRRRMGFIFQDYALIPRLPLWENITYPLIPRGVGAKLRRKQAEAILIQVGLTGYETKRPDELSGGERQRAAIARAVIGNPGVLLADEPTAHLDAESADGIRAILTRLHEKGATILIATHDPQMVSLADLQYTLSRGSIV